MLHVRKAKHGEKDYRSGIGSGVGSGASGLAGGPPRAATLCGNWREDEEVGRPRKGHRAETGPSRTR